MTSGSSVDETHSLETFCGSETKYSFMSSISIAVSDSLVLKVKLNFKTEVNIRHKFLELFLLFSVNFLK